MTYRLFVTGTDTAVGKTEVAVALLKMAQQQNHSTAAIKPVSAGCEEVDGQLRNEDGVQLLAQCTVPMTYEELNPIALKDAIAPHLAAHFEGRSITADRLVGLSQNIFSKKADLTVIEGAGGWRVPLNHREFMSHYVKQLNLPVLVVVGVRLGCLNHSLLTVEAILNDNLPLVGWVANCIDGEMGALAENIQTLAQLIPAPCIGVVPFNAEDPQSAIEQHLNLNLLLEQLKKV